MHACGLSKAVFVKAAMVLALFTSIYCGGQRDVMDRGPQRHQDEVPGEAKANRHGGACSGQFQQAINGGSVLFIESVDGSNFKDVFPRRPPER